VESVEASGRTIEDAILQALARLGRNRNEVEITVLQEPSRGVRGMGAREARVRVFLKQGRPAGAVMTPEMADELLPNEEYEEEEEGFFEDGEYAEEGEEEYAEAEQDGYAYAPQAEAPQDYDYREQQRYPRNARGGAQQAPAPVAAPTVALSDELPEDASFEEVAVAALSAIMAHMGIYAEIEMFPAEGEEEPLTLNIHARDRQLLGLLIGRRGETLAALQLLMNLVVSKQTGIHERVIVDVEGYRQRREANLRSMAERVAQQVRQSGHPVMLEAMPPNERRIIHMQLSEYPDISTESEGEGDQRRVVVSLKRGAHL
jgi:spoIIIJ-associated protein